MASEAKPRYGQDVGRVEMLAGMIPLTNDNEESTDGEMPDLVDSEPEAYHFPLKRKTRPRMDLSVGKVLVRYAALDERLARQLRKKHEQTNALCERPAFESVVKPSDACLSSRREKNRVTFFRRQHITGLFDPDATIKSHIGCSVLLVPAAKPVRLEDNENCREMHAMLLDNKDGAVEAARMGGYIRFARVPKMKICQEDIHYNQQLHPAIT